ncbi:MAG TPA: DUF2306 domain-containing protein [Burkholderiaceae bacterium]|nr:DUF2306 domain-containing protein [Burkholderiaceae bacterium]HPH14607.1 DUF2306 domain-containing protein [Burkholderiaceae bacterium]
MQHIPQLTPLIAVHMTAALIAIAIGPLAIWARKGRLQRPKVHRAFGYAWVTLMIVTALSAIFISDPALPHFMGFGYIHLLILVTLGMIFVAFRFLVKGNVVGHRKTMINLYIGACVVAGAFTFLPGRYLGHMVWHQWLGLV